MKIKINIHQNGINYVSNIVDWPFKILPIKGDAFYLLDFYNFGDFNIKDLENDPSELDLDSYFIYDSKLFERCNNINIMQLYFNDSNEL